MSNLFYFCLPYIKEHEGIRYNPYKDIMGHITIGIGRNLDGKGLDYQEIIDLFKNDVNQLDNSFKKIPPFCSFYPLLNDARKVALIDLGFMGIGKLSSFVNMLDALSKRDWQRAHDELLDSDYARELPNRAHDNADVFLTGKIK